MSEEGGGRRRSSSRSKKSPQRFVAGAAGARTGADFAVPAKKAKQRQFLEPSTLSPDTLLGRRVAVFWPRCKKWFKGRVSDYKPDKGEEAFQIHYDDGDKEWGLFGQNLFRTKNRDAPFQWLEVDMERPGMATGATEQSKEAPEVPTADCEQQAGPPAKLIYEVEGKAELSEEEQKVATKKCGEANKDNAPEAVLAGAKEQVTSEAHMSSGQPSTEQTAVIPKKEATIAPPAETPPADQAPAARVAPQAAQRATSAAGVENGLAAKESAPKCEGRRKKALDVNAATPCFGQAQKVGGLGGEPSAPSVAPEAPPATQKVGNGERTVPVFAEAELPDLAVSTAAARDSKLVVVEKAMHPEGSKLTSPQREGQEEGHVEAMGSLEQLPKPAEGGFSLQHFPASGAPKRRSPQEQAASSPKKPKVQDGAAKAAQHSPANLAKNCAEEPQEAAAKRQRLTDKLHGHSPEEAAKPSLPLQGEHKSKPRTTSIAAPRSFSLLPKPSSGSPVALKSPEAPEYEPDDEDSGLPDDLVQADIICSRMEGLLAGLTRARDSIGRATSMALSAAKVGAAPRVIRLIADSAEKVDSPAKRIDLLYLIDSILQGCVREGKPDCGPGSAAADAFPRVVAAALPRLVGAAIVSKDGVEKAGKVLQIWRKRKLVSESLLQPQLLRLDAAREVLASQPAPLPQPRAAAQREPPSTGKKFQLAIGSGAGTGAVSAELENQYGTHMRVGEEDSDSDDEPDEHERELRAQADAARQQEARKRGAAESSRSKVPWASGTEAGALEGGDCPPGFSLDSSNPMRIPLKRTPNNRVLSSAPSQEKKPVGGGSSGYRAPAVSAFTSSFGDDDRLDAAGAGDRTFEEEEEPPPLPAEDWNAPPLPEESPPLPADEERPPLPLEPPFIEPHHFAGSQVQPGAGSDEMDWESAYNPYSAAQQQQQFYAPRPAAPLPPHGLYQPGRMRYP